MVVYRSPMAAGSKNPSQFKYLRNYHAQPRPRPEWMDRGNLDYFAQQARENGRQGALPGVAPVVAETQARIAQQPGGVTAASAAAPIGALPTVPAPVQPTPKPEGRPAPSMLFHDVNNPARDRYMGLLQMGMGMMAEGGQPGSTFASALGKGGLLGLQGAEALRREREEKEAAAAKAAAAQAQFEATLGLKQTQHAEKMAIEHEKAKAAEDKARQEEAWKQRKFAWDVQKFLDTPRGTDAERLATDMVASGEWTQEQANAFLVDTISKAGVQVNIGEKTAEKAVIENATENIHRVPAMVDTVRTIQDMQELYAKGVPSGGFTPDIVRANENLRSIGIDLDGVAKALGISVADGLLGKTQKSQEMLARANTLIHNKIAAMGSAKLADSAAELKRIAESLPGMAFSPEASQALLDSMETQYMEAIDKELRRIEHMEKRGLGEHFAFDKEELASSKTAIEARREQIKELRGAGAAGPSPQDLLRRLDERMGGSSR